MGNCFGKQGKTKPFTLYYNLTRRQKSSKRAQGSKKYFAENVSNFQAIPPPEMNQRPQSTYSQANTTTRGVTQPTSEMVTDDDPDTDEDNDLHEDLGNVTTPSTAHSPRLPLNTDNEVNLDVHATSPTGGTRQQIEIPPISVSLTNAVPQIAKEDQLPQEEEQQYSAS